MQGLFLFQFKPGIKDIRLLGRTYGKNLVTIFPGINAQWKWPKRMSELKSRWVNSFSDSFYLEHGFRWGNRFIIDLSVSATDNTLIQDNLYPDDQFPWSDKYVIEPCVPQGNITLIFLFFKCFPSFFLVELARITILFSHSPNGKFHLDTNLPDTITTWVVQAVGISNQTGLGVARPLNIQAFKNFFVSLRLPYSVQRGEQISVIATVFNYGDIEFKVRMC